MIEAANGAHFRAVFVAYNCICGIAASNQIKMLYPLAPSRTLRTKAPQYPNDLTPFKPVDVHAPEPKENPAGTLIDRTP